MKKKKNHKDIQQIITREKKNVINKIVKMYPTLDKKEILDQVMGSGQVQLFLAEKTFTKVIIREKEYYLDDIGWIWENTDPCKIVGAYQYIDDNYIYYFRDIPKVKWI